MYLAKHPEPSPPDQPLAISPKRKREGSLELDRPSAKKRYRLDITGNSQDDQAEATGEQLSRPWCESTNTVSLDQAPSDSKENTVPNNTELGGFEEKVSLGDASSITKGHSNLEEEWGYIMSTATATVKRSGSDASSKPVSTSSRSFRQQLRLNNVLEAEYSLVPANLHQIQEFLNGSRRSTSPAEEDYLDYESDVINAVNEMTLQVAAWTAVCKRMRASDAHGKRLEYSSVCDLPFNKIPKDVGFNHGISPPQPDLALGFRWYDFNFSPKPFQIAGIIPHDDRNTIALPHLFGEYKKPGGAYQEAAAQAAYDGAYGTWARSQVLKVIGDDENQRMAHVFSFASDGMTMRFFAHFRDVSDQIRYHQHEIFPATPLIQTAESHRLMYRRMRNMQELAFQNADSLRQRIAQWQSLQLLRPPIPNTKLTPREASSLNGCDEAAGVTLPSPAASSKRAASTHGDNALTPSQKRPMRGNNTH